LRKPGPPLIADANVLIDFMDADPSVLGLLARETGPVMIAAEVLAKVDQLSTTTCDRLGLTIVEATLDQLIEAGQRRPGLAFDDVVCLVLARDHEWCCVTNDRALRAACEASNVDVRWGLEVMLPLVARAALSTKDAIEVALTIQQNNRAFITEPILRRFKAKAARAASSRRRSKGA